MIVPDVRARLDDDGLFICSGIINTKVDRVRKALSENDMVIVEEQTRNDWYALAVKKK